jgi:hypothetical protein
LFLPGLQYVSKAVAAKVIAARRAEVHDRYVKYWAKKLIVSPELAAVPLKEVDAQLASKFEVGKEWVEHDCRDAQEPCNMGNYVSVHMLPWVSMFLPWN